MTLQIQQQMHNIRSNLYVCLFLLILLSNIAACKSTDNQTLNLNFITKNYGDWLSTFDQNVMQFRDTESVIQTSSTFSDSVCPGSKLPDIFTNSLDDTSDHKTKTINFHFSANVFRVFYNSRPVVLVNNNVITGYDIKKNTVLVYLKANPSLREFNLYHDNKVPDASTFARKTVPFATFCRHEGKLKLQQISKELAEIAVSMTQYDLDQ